MVEAYLKRIKHNSTLELNPDSLRTLHKCHVMSIPFESLDIYLKHEIKLDLTHIYHKVIDQKRGGFCYELNYLFHSLLTQIGFDASMVSSRIFDQGSYGPNYDHMSILVKLEENWLVDVGYGDLFIEPLNINSTQTQEDHFKDYKIEPIDGDTFLLSESLRGEADFKERYIFNLEPQTIEAFTDQCYYKQTHPDSYFVKNTVCTLPTKTGRKTIFNNRFKQKSHKVTTEKTIENDDELFELLQREFGLSLSTSPLSM